MRQIVAVILLAVLALPSVTYAQSPLSEVRTVALTLADLPKGYILLQTPDTYNDPIAKVGTYKSRAGIRLFYGLRDSSRGVRVSVTLWPSRKEAVWGLQHDDGLVGGGRRWHPVFIGQTSRGTFENDHDTHGQDYYRLGLQRGPFTATLLVIGPKHKVNPATVAAYARLMDHRIIVLLGGVTILTP
jgi:hypothetical protein